MFLVAAIWVDSLLDLLTFAKKSFLNFMDDIFALRDDPLFTYPF